MLIYREDNLERVARVVLKYNPYLKGSEIEDVIKIMKSTAETADHSPQYGYVATRGFCLSFYHLDNGDVGVYASVAEHCFS